MALSIDLDQNLYSQIYEWLFPADEEYDCLKNLKTNPTFEAINSKKKRVPNFIRYVRFNDFKAEISFSGFIKCKNVNVEINSWVKRHEFWTSKQIMDKYLKFLMGSILSQSPRIVKQMYSKQNYDKEDKLNEDEQSSPENMISPAFSYLKNKSKKDPFA